MWIQIYSQFILPGSIFELKKRDPDPLSKVIKRLFSALILLKISVIDDIFGSVIFQKLGSGGTLSGSVKNLCSKTSVADP